MPYDSPLPILNILRIDEGSMTLQELMVFCITLSKKVESLETDLKQTKLTYGAAYIKLIKKVKKLENKVKSIQARRRARIIICNDEDDLEDPSKQGRKIAKIDQDSAISLVQHDAEIQERHVRNSVFSEVTIIIDLRALVQIVNFNVIYKHEHVEFDFDLDTAKDVSTAKPVSTAGAAVTTDSATAVSTASPTRRVSTVDDITMAETLVYIRKSAAKYKGKGKMDESETVQTKTKLQQEQERLGFEAAVRLQDELKEEERKRIAMRLQVEEKEMYSEAEQARMLVELINQRKRYFATQRAEERKNKPPTQAQQRTYMSNYIKHMGGYTLQQLRGYSFDEIKTLFETTMRRVNTFVSIESEVDKAVPKLATRSSKRAAEEELDQESFKRQKTGESSELAKEPRDKEADELSQEELQQMMIIVPEQGMNALGSIGRSSELEIILRKPKRKDTHVPQPSDPTDNIADEAVYKELGDSLVRAATIVSSLEAEQDIGNIIRPNPRQHLMNLVPKELIQVLDLEKTKTTQHNEIASLKRRVKKFEKKNRSRTHRRKRLYKVVLTTKVESFDNEESLGEDAPKQGRIDAIDVDEEITMDSVHDVNVYVDSVVGDIVSAATTVSTATTAAIIKTVDDITLAQALKEMKSTKPKKKGVVIQELGESTTTISLQLSSQQSKDKGKSLLIEPVKPMKKKDQIRLDEETTLDLQAKFNEEERLAREKTKKEEEANIALIET
ncbi:hypothetical protein Tco_1264140 [Tanacetum coccineum]